jgi:hypothetical protein
MRGHKGCVSVWGRKHPFGKLRASSERVCKPMRLTNSDQSKDAALHNGRSASFDYGLRPFAQDAPLLFAPNVKCTRPQTAI